MGCGVSIISTDRAQREVAFAKIMPIRWQIVKKSLVAL